MDKLLEISVDKIILNAHRNTPYRRVGKIHSTHGQLYEVVLAKAVQGSQVEFVTRDGERYLGEIVGLKGSHCLAMPYEDILGINSETLVYFKDLTTQINISDNMLGRVLNFQGDPIDDKGEILGPFHKRSIYHSPQNPLDRPPISEALDSGVRSINAFTTIGKGQRIAIMAGSGVGKSVLLGMIARNTKADINIIALVGERGREVVEFIENDLGPEGLKRSVLIVATSDTSPLVRIKAAYTAVTIAEYFRDQGRDVNLMMDSVTRFAMAYREVALSSGEAPGQRGYAPSVFSKLPKLMERCGTKKNSGKLTGLFTVLVEGGDMDEPVADNVRSIVDGHIVLSRELAAKNFYPAIDVLESISRVMPNVISKEHRIVASYLRDLLAAYHENENLINVGAYVPGSNPRVDKAMAIVDDFEILLRQEIDEGTTLEQVYDAMVEIARKAEKSQDKEEVKVERKIDLNQVM